MNSTSISESPKINEVVKESLEEILDILLKEVTKITQSSCYRNSGGTSQIYITVMIEYIELITDFGYSTIYPPLV